MGSIFKSFCYEGVSRVVRFVKMIKLVQIALSRIHVMRERIHLLESRYHAIVFRLKFWYIYNLETKAIYHTVGIDSVVFT